MTPSYASDTAFTTHALDTTGYWVESRRGGTGADGALQLGDRVNVWPITVITRNPNAYTRNGLAMCTVECSVNPAPSIDVAIAAS